MGITGLLPFVRKAWREASLAEFEGATVAVDVYCWIHKGAFACAEALALNKPTDQFVAYCLRLVRLLQRFKIKPILVFDGKKLPAKSDTEEKRRESRVNYRQRAAGLLAAGRRSEARECFERSVTVTQEMALRVLRAARKLHVDCLVAPYESDAQLAYLCRPGGLADLALTEDSDLLAFGCERVFFKLDLNAGRGVVIERDRLLEEVGLSADRFRHMCLLAGCDYHPGIQGVGLITAARVMTRTRLGDFGSLLAKLRLYLPRLDGAQLSPAEIEALMQAEQTFQHQIVFDPLQRRQRPLTPYPKDRDPLDFAFAGIAVADSRLALQLALGNADFETNAAIGNFDPATACQQQQQQQQPRHLMSIFHPRYRPRPVEQRVLKAGAEAAPVEAVEQRAPEALTGREEVVTVQYRVPKMCPSGDVEPADLISQYFPAKTEVEEGKEKEAMLVKEEEEEETKENIAITPPSPVFHRVQNNNQFATSPDPPAKRARFSLDQGCCSSPGPPRPSPEKAPTKGRTFLHDFFPTEELEIFQPTTATSPRKPLTALSPPNEKVKSPMKKSPFSAFSFPSRNAASAPVNVSAAASASVKARVSGLKGQKSVKGSPARIMNPFFANFKKLDKEKLRLG